MAQEAEVVKNKQVMLKVYVTGLPGESDFNIRTHTTISLKVPESSNNGVLVKNLYLSCDPFMRLLMQKPESSLQDVISGYSPGSTIGGFGVAKVVDSRHPKFEKGDSAWGQTKWEEYSLIAESDSLIKIEHTEVPLSYYTGLLVEAPNNSLSEKSSTSCDYSARNPGKKRVVESVDASWWVAELAGSCSGRWSSRKESLVEVGAALFVAVRELGCATAVSLKEKRECGWSWVVGRAGGWRAAGEVQLSWLWAVTTWVTVFIGG
ncbi:2-alkenal reductase (NADP(+)-dependent)-like, partial [Coffea eugenioides]|uniref:2-alkenal reductase (NADP(+)-dependent)-like n=1 Tax=Coffea eugenioides TaxID=49369 RepID=UPI000F607F13